MKEASINRFAIFGALIGFICMALFLIYTDRPRSVPMIGYIIEMFTGAVIGAGVLSLVAWINNLAASKSLK